MVLGLHLLDLLVVLGFVAITLGVGIWVSRGVKHEGDFYLGGRKMGKALQFFLNFGNSTDPTGAGQTASEVYRQGAGGVWMSLQTLFITPFFWFTQPWYRRARVITMADLFVDRFNSKSIASMYAAFNVVIALLLLGAGNLTSYKIVSAMVVKPESAYTEADKREIAEFQEYQSLRQVRESGTAAEEQKQRLEVLDSKVKRDELHSFITYIPKAPFYILYSLVVATYIMLGGLKAAAVTDAVQGVLILIMSFILIPLGINHVGGFAALHRIVPEFKFQLLGTVQTSEYTWYTITAITFASLIQILGLSHNMASGGSATNENTARFGMITGGFTKRFVIIAWMFSGLLGVAVLGSNLTDPDNAWGALSKSLLGPGLLGLMIAGMLLGHMPAVGMSSVAVSGLITRNIYEPLFRGRSPKHYLMFGQIMIPTVLFAAVIVAMAFTGVVALYEMIITFNTFFGAVVFLIFFWRRLTPKAIMIAFVIWVSCFGVLPLVVQYIKPLRQWQPVTLRTEERMVLVKVAATAEDVAAGRAAKEGQAIMAERPMPRKACFFDSVALIKGETNRYEGLGRFHMENFILSYLGVPYAKLPPAVPRATRWFFDGLFPFFMLIIFSLFTKPVAPELADRFYVKLKTRVASTPEEDHQQIQEGFATPHRFDHLKLFPRSNWEFMKWTKEDFLGFFGCWGVVMVILGFLWFIVNFGK